MPPAWLLWLLPVPVATVAAIAWTSWSSRTRGPETTASSVRAHERFRAALAAPLPPADPRGQPGPDRTPDPAGESTA